MTARRRQMTNFGSTGHCEWLYSEHNQKLSRKDKNGGSVKCEFGLCQGGTEMKTLRVTQAEFGRLVGMTRARINQLVKSGLLVDDGQGLPLVESLKRFYSFRAVKHYVDTQPTSDYFQRVLKWL